MCIVYKSKIVYQYLNKVIPHISFHRCHQDATFDPVSASRSLKDGSPVVKFYSIIDHQNLIKKNSFISKDLGNKLIDNPAPTLL